MVTHSPRRDDPIFRHAAAPCKSCRGSGTERWFDPRTGNSHLGVCTLCAGAGVIDLNRPEAPDYD